MNTQSFIHHNSASKFIKGKSRDLQKLLQYLKEIVTFGFKGGNDGLGGPSPSPGFPGYRV